MVCASRTRRNVSKQIHGLVFSSVPLRYIYFFLSAWAGGIKKKLQSVWIGSGRNFPIRPALGGRNRHLLKNVSILSGNLSIDLSYYVSKNLSVKPLSSTWIISVFITICSLEIVQFVANLAMITALKYSGLLHVFRCFVEKNKNVIHQPRLVRIGKNCALSLEYCPRPVTSGRIQDLGHSFSQYRPPGWWITYIYWTDVIFVWIIFAASHASNKLTNLFEKTIL